MGLINSVTNKFNKFHISSKVVETTDNVLRIPVENIIFTPVALPDSSLVTNEFYDIDSFNHEVKIKQSFIMSNDFKVFETGAGEIDIAFRYEPADSSFHEINELTISIGICGDSYKIIKKYEETNELPENVRLFKLSGSIAFYKTIIEYKKYNSTYIEYHYRRGLDDVLYSQMQLIIPADLVDSELARKGEQVLEQLVSTYCETILTDE